MPDATNLGLAPVVAGNHEATGGLRFTEGIVLALLTGTAYMSAFSFEAGWARAFGYSVQLIDLQLVPTLFLTFLSLTVLSWFWNFSEFLPAILERKQKEHPLVRELRAALVAFLVVGAFFAVNDFKTNKYFEFVFGFLVFLLGFNLTFPLLQFHDVPGYFAKLQAQHEYRVSRRAATPLMSKFRGFEKLLLASVLVLGLCYTAGHAQATRNRLFFVVKQPPDWVVLRIYGSRAIAAELIRSDKGFRPHYRIFNLDDSDTVLTSEELGPLVPLRLPIDPSIGPTR